MAIKRYSLFTTINAAQTINLSDVVNVDPSKNNISRCQIHDIFADNPVIVRCKLNDTFRDFSTTSTDWSRVELAFLEDIQIEGTVNATVLEMVGSDQKSDT